MRSPRNPVRVQVRGVEDILAVAGARCGISRRTSPDLNPIERCFAKLKAIVRPALQPLNAAIFGIAVTQALNDHGNRSSRLGQRMEKHYPPEHLKRQFYCVHCGVFAAQQWEELFYQRGGRITTVDHWG